MRPWSLSMSTWTLRLSAGAAAKKAAISPRRHGKHEVGPVAHDHVRDGGITSDGVDGHERALERAGGGEPLQEHRDRILLARLVRDRLLAEHKALVGREG